MGLFPLSNVLGCVHNMLMYASWQGQPDTKPDGFFENSQRPHRKWHSVAKCIPTINEMTLSFVHSILFECWILTKAAWGQSARPHYLLSSEMARLLLKRTDTSRVRVGTILPTGTGQWTRQHQFWQCHLALPTGIGWSTLIPHTHTFTAFQNCLLSSSGMCMA